VLGSRPGYMVAREEERCESVAPQCGMTAPTPRSTDRGNLRRSGRDQVVRMMNQRRRHLRHHLSSPSHFDVEEGQIAWLTVMCSGNRINNKPNHLWNLRRSMSSTTGYYPPSEYNFQSIALAPSSTTMPHSLLSPSGQPTSKISISR
jgi:hypothetical protein